MNYHKLEKLQEMDKFQCTYQIRARRENLNRPATSNDFEAVIKIIPTKKSPGVVFIAEFYQTFQKDLISALLKIGHKGTLPTCSVKTK